MAVEAKASYGINRCVFLRNDVGLPTKITLIHIYRVLDKKLIVIFVRNIDCTDKNIHGIIR